MRPTTTAAATTTTTTATATATATAATIDSPSKTPNRTATQARLLWALALRVLRSNETRLCCKKVSFLLQLIITDYYSWSQKLLPVLLFYWP